MFKSLYSCFKNGEKCQVNVICKSRNNICSMSRVRVFTNVYLNASVSRAYVRTCYEYLPLYC